MQVMRLGRGFGRIIMKNTVRCQASAAGAAPAAPSFNILKYDYVSDILDKRGPYRADHLAGAQKAADAGKLYLAGAIAEPVDGGLFIFKNTDKADIETFVKNDPYFRAGLIKGYSIRPYMVVVGGN